jgi:amidase
MERPEARMRFRGRRGKLPLQVESDFYLQTGRTNSTKGPIASSRSGLDLFMETYLSYEPWIKEDSLVPIPWRTVTLPPKLKIAVMWSDNIVTPHPPITRALKEVAKTLRAAGHEVVDWKPEGHDECWDITQALYFEDGGKNIEEMILKGGEELLPLTK